MPVGEVGRVAGSRARGGRRSVASSTSLSLDVPGRLVVRSVSGGADTRLGSSKAGRIVREGFLCNVVVALAGTMSGADWSVALVPIQEVTLA